MGNSFKNTIRPLTEPAYYKLFLIPNARKNQRRAIKAIRSRGLARIVFIVSSLPMWRFQQLYDLLRNDNRFQVELALFPFWASDNNERDRIIHQLCSGFDQKGIPYINLAYEMHPGEKLRAIYNPDIIFYPQPYNHLFGNDLDSPFFSDKLLCYIPYAMLTAKEVWAYKSYLNNVAWRLFFSSEERKKEAERVLYNKGQNIRISGEPMADLFSDPVIQDPWHPQKTLKKRVIWAPHFSIVDEGYLHRDSFTSLSTVMLEIATKYQDKVQFAFKPHPRLCSTLYNLPNWGKKRTDDYYNRWEKGQNTQLEMGGYIDLFKCSDAIIHDCGSFSVEYHFTGKPALFITDDVLKTTQNLNEFGREAILVHYIGKTKDDITRFLDDVVLDGNDPLQEKRAQFRQDYLNPPAGNCVAENIYNEIVGSIGFDR